MVANDFSNYLTSSHHIGHTGEEEEGGGAWCSIQIAILVREIKKNTVRKVLEDFAD